MSNQSLIQFTELKLPKIQCRPNIYPGYWQVRCWSKNRYIDFNTASELIPYAYIWRNLTTEKIWFVWLIHYSGDEYKILLFFSFIYSMIQFRTLWCCTSQRDTGIQYLSENLNTVFQTFVKQIFTIHNVINVKKLSMTEKVFLKWFLKNEQSRHITSEDELHKS